MNNSSGGDYKMDGNTKEMETKEEKKESSDARPNLQSIQIRLQNLKMSGRLTQMLCKIAIDENGSFTNERKHSSLPPYEHELKREDIDRWGFSTLPDIAEFGSDHLKEGKSYNELLTSDRNYNNPYGIHNMVLSYDINEHTSLLHDLSFPENEGYEKVRLHQNKEWAEQRLLRGVEFAKEGKLKDALKCYNEAIDLAPNYAEAFTARGAAFFKLSKYKESVASFEAALSIDPNTPNARQYLEKAQMMITQKPINVAATSEIPKTYYEKEKEKEMPYVESVKPKSDSVDQHLLELLKREADRSHSRSSHKRRHHSHSEEHSHHKHHHHS